MLIETFSVAAGVVAAVTGPALVAARRGRSAARQDLARVQRQAREASATADRRLAEERQKAEGEIARRDTEAGRALDRADARARELLDQVRWVTEETEHLCTVRVPALLASLRAPHVRVPGLLHDELAGGELDWHHRALLNAVAQGVRAESERVDEAGLAVVRGVLARLHRMNMTMQDKIEDMGQVHADASPALLRALMDLDMLNELIGRAVQTPAVACGATALLFREQTHLADVVMSAASRVQDFQRRIGEPANHLVRRVGVAEQAVEPLRVIVSALLANAVECSHGTLPVEVELHETQTGASITVDDAGVGLNEEQLDRARTLLGGECPVRLVDLGDPPKTGWAAVGMLVRQHGFRVTVRKGRHGGVSAVVNIPNALLVEMPHDTQPSPLAPEPIRTLPTLLAGGKSSKPQAAGTGLPTRRRYAPDPSPEPTPATAPAAPAVAERTPEEAGKLWGSWRSGQQKGRALADQHSHPGSDDSERN
ncbi:ATP-binding protein [Streptomyces sp. NPDC055036]